MHPFYFGPSQGPLFGVYHEATGGRPSRSRGVVLCHPYGHEYIRAHRAFRNLADDLSRRGWHVLRFDYSGTGDSSGEAIETGIARSIADINQAVDELKDMSGVAQVSLVGLRIGATLAALAASQRSDVGTLVAWDPVTSGAAYLAQTRNLHEGWIRNRPWMRNAEDTSAREAMGYPVSPAFERELMELDIRTIKKCRARRSCVVVSGTGDPHQDARLWQQHVSTTSGQDAYVEVPEVANDWYDPTVAHRGLLPRRILDVIATLLEDARVPLAVGTPPAAPSS
jgi:pimeloyl-ACP methyl ester carboxylesterase